MTQRQEIIERLRAVDLGGGSHEMLNAICKAVLPHSGAWTLRMCEDLRDRLVRLLGSDAVHEDALSRLYMDMSDSEWVRLPKDADGEYIHVGDKVTCGASVWEVTGFRFTGGFWGICCTIFNDQGGSGTNVYPPSDLHHYHAPTVEDVLREFALRVAGKECMTARPDVITEYAAKLRLADDGKEQ